MRNLVGPESHRLGQTRMRGDEGIRGAEGWGGDVQRVQGPVGILWTLYFMPDDMDRH